MIKFKTLLESFQISSALIGKFSKNKTHIFHIKEFFEIYFVEIYSS